MINKIIVIGLLFVVSCSFNKSPSTGTETPNFVKGVVYNSDNSIAINKTVEIKSVLINNRGDSVFDIDTVITDEKGEFLFINSKNSKAISVIGDTLGAQAVFNNKMNISLKLGKKVVVKGRILNNSNVLVGIVGTEKWSKLNNNNEYTINNVSPGIYPITIISEKDNIINLIWVTLYGNRDTVFIRDIDFKKKNDSKSAIEDKILSKKSVYVYDVKYKDYSLDSIPDWYKNKSFDGVNYIDFDFKGNNIVSNYAKLATKDAIGYGKYATGGRGGNIYIVNNLSDDGLPGSFRYAVSQTGKRIVVFSVAGNVELNSPIKISNGDLTILGQTSPGGITLKNYGIVLEANNIVCSYLKIRPGLLEKEDGIWIKGAKNVYVNHCNISWTRDESIGITDGCDSVSIVSTLFSHGLYKPVDSVMAKSVGMLVECPHISIINNSFSSYNKTISLNNTSSSVEVYNNIFYNYGDYAISIESGDNINIENNYFKYSNATTNIAKHNFIDIFVKYGFIYQSENRYYNNEQLETVTIENLFGDYENSLLENRNIMCETSFDNLMLDSILLKSGNYKYRDSYDNLIIDGIKNSTVLGNSTKYQEYSNINISTGIIDDPNSIGGWPIITQQFIITDNDSDGIDDNWENSNGLNSSDHNDSKSISSNGLSNIENYALDLVK